MIFLFFFYSLGKVVELYDLAEYQKVILVTDSLLADSLEKLKHEEKIRTYRAFSFVAMGDTSSAKKEFKQILKISPSYDLNPAFVSPKIIEVFRISKLEFIREKETVNKNLPPPLWKSILLPGTYQDWKKLEKKSRFFKTTSIMTGSTLLLTMISTEILHRVYLSKKNQDEIDKWYGYYNLSYKVRNTTLLTYGIVFTLNLLDVLLTE